jgi:hypothetical protein
LIHQIDEIIKQGFNIMRTWTRFRVALKAESRTISALNTLQTTIK